VNIVLGVAVLCIAAIGGTYAYLADNESNYTNLVVGGVLVDLCEAGMEGADGLQYGEVYTYNSRAGHNISISPYAKNSGYQYDEAIVFIEVVVPLIDSLLIDDTENKQPDHGNGLTDAFSFTFGGDKDDNSLYNYYGDDLSGKSERWNGNGDRGAWVYIDKTYYTDNDGEVSCGYLYGYCRKLIEWESTATLFNWAKAANFAVGVTDIYLEIPIRLYAIQADPIKGSNVIIESGNTDTSVAKEVNVNSLDASDLRYIFNTYVNQNYDSYIDGNFNDAEFYGSNYANGDPK